MLNHFLRNKKGGEKIFSIWWFLVLVIVATGITVGLIIFYHANVDLRQYEAQLLSQKVSDCLIKEGYIVEGVLSNQFDILSGCNLDRKVFGDGKEFYFKLEFLDDDGQKIVNDFFAGNTNLDQQCEFQKSGGKAEYYARCVWETKDFLYFDGGEVKRGRLRMITASINQGVKLPLIKND